MRHGFCCACTERKSQKLRAEEIEDGVYLILAEEDEVSVEVQTGETWQYQDGGKRGDGT